MLTRSDIKNLKDNLYLEIIYNEGQKDTIKLRYKRDYKNDSLFFLKQKIGSNPKISKSLDKGLTKVELEEPKDEKPKEEVKPTIKEEKKTQEKTIEKKEETRQEEQQPKEEQPKDETIIEEQTNNEEPPEPEITPELIINKIKEKCTLDLDTYVCEYPNIVIFYYEGTNQITIFKDDDTYIDYDIVKDKCFGPPGDCKEELNKKEKNTLLS